MKADVRTSLQRNQMQLLWSKSFAVLFLIVGFVFSFCTASSNAEEFKPVAIDVFFSADDSLDQTIVQRLNEVKDAMAST